MRGEFRSNIYLCKAGTCRQTSGRILGSLLLRLWAWAAELFLGASHTVLHTGWLQRRPHLHSVLIPGVALGWANPANQ